jgi:hypothetical protein
MRSEERDGANSSEAETTTVEVDSDTYALRPGAEVNYGV